MLLGEGEGVYYTVRSTLCRGGTEAHYIAPHPIVQYTAFVVQTLNPIMHIPNPKLESIKSFNNCTSMGTKSYIK